MPDIPYRVIAKLLTIIFDKPLPPPSSTELEMVAELKSRFQKLPLIPVENMPPSEAEWAANMQRLRQLVLNDDPRRFLRWDVVRSTMFVTHPAYIQKELNYLKKQPDWNNRWRQAIKESQCGHPIPYPFYPGSSGNLIHNAYHLSQFEQRIHSPVEDMAFVLEFGGGYGSMCRLFHQLGFKGAYVIIDLPPFSALQRYFLKSSDIPVQDLQALSSAQGVFCVSEPDDLRSVLSGHLFKNKAMFVSTWAISETPMHIRQKFMPFINLCDYYLIAYQHRFKEMDNIRYFTDWRKIFDNQMTWHDYEIKHLPGSSYLIGERLMPGARRS